MAIEQSIKTLFKRKLVLADPNSRTRGEMARYLRSVGAEVFEAQSVPEACDLVRAQVPALVVFDLDLTGDVGRLLHVIAEKRNGAVVKALLTCRARTSKARLVPVVGLGSASGVLGGILLTPCRPEAMIEKAAMVLDSVTSAKAAAHAAAELEAAVSVVEGNNSLLSQRVLCPFHEEEVRARRFALRINHIEMEPDFFDVPVYTKAVGRADYVNYHHLCVTVCPECLFASADPGHFAMPHDKRHVMRTLTHTAKYAIASRAHQRRELVGAIDEDFFSDKRGASGAIKSLELALQCSETLHRVAKHVYTDELVRQGNYHLRIALLQKQGGGSSALRDEHIDRASRLLKEAFPSLPESGLPRNLYQVVATSIYMGEDKEAHQYLTQLSRLSRTSRDPSLRTSMDRYLGRSTNAWENRQENRRVVVPSLAPVPFLNAPFVAQAA